MGFCSNCSFTSTLHELNKLAFEKNATRRAVGESRAEVFSLKKNKRTHSFVSGPHVFPCCFSPLGE